jgi:hypothetical protein
MKAGRLGWRPLLLIAQVSPRPDSKVMPHRPFRVVIDAVTLVGHELPSRHIRASSVHPSTTGIQRCESDGS